MADGPLVRCEFIGDVLVATLNRPQVLNALDDATLDALLVTWSHARDGVGAVVLTGAGRAFCAGADLRAPARVGDELAENQRRRYNANAEAIAALDCPVVAAVNGVAAGAGLSMACVADVRIASAQAVFVPAFAKIGVVPDMGASCTLPQLIGHGRAFDWLCSNRSLTAGEAQAIGLVSEVVDHAAVVERAVERAEELCRLPGRAVALTKQLLRQGWSSDLADQLEREVQAQQLATAAVAPREIADRTANGAAREKGRP